MKTLSENEKAREGYTGSSCGFFYFRYLEATIKAC
jgi:hypothetical protein